jgi:alanine dehydrogenase
VPHTSTYALTNATLPYVLSVADRGVQGAIEHDPALRGGLTTIGGQVTNAAVAEAMGVPAAEPPHFAR